MGSAPSLCIAGGGFEWDDDFPLMPVKPSLVASLPGTPAEPPAAVPALPALVPAQKQVLPIQFSRFTVSPAPVSRFSITHVSDSDMDSIGGESPSGCCPVGAQDYPCWELPCPRAMGHPVLALCGDSHPCEGLGVPRGAGTLSWLSLLVAGSSEDGDRE